MTMSHFDKPVFEIENITERIEGLVEAVNISAALRRQVLEAGVIIYPQIGFREDNKPLFPQGTAEIFHYLQSKLDPKTVVEICIEDVDFKELVLHADLKRLGKFIVANVVLAAFINVMSNYIYDYITSKSKNTNISISIMVVKTNGIVHKKINYEGSAQDFAKIAEQIKRLSEESGE